MTKFIQGVNDKIIAIVLDQDNETEGGIIIPENVQKDPQLYCEIISVGELVGKEVKVGGTLLCHRNGGMDIMFKGSVYKVLKYDEIYGILKEE